MIARASKHSDASEYGSKRGQGGVALLWRKTLGGVSPITSLVNDRICGIRLQCETGRVLNILAVYMSAPGSSDDYGETLDDLAEAIENMERGSLTLICGDFNGDMGHLGGPKSNRKPTNTGRKLMKFFDEFSLNPCNLSDIAKGPVNTFRGGVGSSTIDYFAVPECLSNEIVSCEVLEDPILNTSDHEALRLVMEFTSLKVTAPCLNVNQSIKWGKVKSTVITSVYTNPANEFCAHLLENNDFDNMSKEGIDQTLDILTSKLVNLGSNLPKSKFKKHVRPFWNGNLTELKKVKVSAYRKWKTEGCPRDQFSETWLNHKIEPY